MKLDKNNGLTPEEYSPVVNFSNYFEVKNGNIWGPRSIIDFELVLILEGGLVYTENDESDILLQTGEILCIRPGVEHMLKATSHIAKNLTISCIHLELSHGNYRTGNYTLESPPPLVTKVEDHTVFQQLFYQCREVFVSNRTYKEILMKNIAHEILLRMAEIWLNETTVSSKVRQMQKYIQKHIKEKISRQDLALKFDMSPEHVNALFKKELNTTPTKYIHRLKIHRACRYLNEESLNIKEVAARLGFYDEFYFSKIFKRETGLRPGELRSRIA